MTPEIQRDLDTAISEARHVLFRQFLIRKADGEQDPDGMLRRGLAEINVCAARAKDIVEEVERNGRQ
jgi:hypothetical protein